REKHFGVDAVLILLAHALPRAAGARRAFVPAVERHVLIAPLAAVQISGGGGPDYFIADCPCVAAVRLAHEAWRPPSIFLRYSGQPMLRVDFQMRVGGNVTVVLRHGSSLLSCHAHVR